MVLGFVGLTAWSELVHWRASRALVHEPPAARSEAVVVLGCRNRRGDRANALNRWRVRAALRSLDDTVPDSILICSGGVTSGTSVSEAVLLARYARAERGFTGTVRLDEQSLNTWENIRNVIPLLEDRDRITPHHRNVQAVNGRATEYRHVGRTDFAVPVHRICRTPCPQQCSHANGDIFPIDIQPGGQQKFV
ncbi:YdcF family protein [Amycolatopsis sp.]|uniref:YdcF family protein n=1 Tax=Amycolatopsis sp. TaxID=37632 RepID=UPI002E19DC54